MSRGAARNTNSSACVRRNRNAQYVPKFDRYHYVVKPQEAGASRPAPASATVGHVSLLCFALTPPPPPPPLQVQHPSHLRQAPCPVSSPGAARPRGSNLGVKSPFGHPWAIATGPGPQTARKPPEQPLLPTGGDACWEPRGLRLILGYRNNAVVGHQGPLVLCHGHAVGYPMIRATRSQASGINAADPCAVAAATQGAAPRGRFRD